MKSYQSKEDVTVYNNGWKLWVVDKDGRTDQFGNYTYIYKDVVSLCIQLRRDGYNPMIKNVGSDVMPEGN